MEVYVDVAKSISSFSGFVVVYVKGSVHPFFVNVTAAVQWAINESASTA